MALPEKQFFSLEEIAKRWDCDLLAVLSYGMRQQSQVAAKGSTDRQDLLLMRLHALVPIGSCQWQTFEELGTRGSNVPAEYKSSFEYCLPEIPVMFVSNLIARGSVQLRYGYFRDQFDVLYRGELVEPGSYSDPIKIYVKDVVVTRGDRDEFERAHNVGSANRGTSRADEGDIHPRTRNNYLRLIMALATTAVKGFDPRKPFEAANAIRETTEIDIDEKTLAGYVSEAFKLQSKERR
jgi:hypothetical protein